MTKAYRRWWAIVGLGFLAIAMLALACSGNPNEDVEADEFFRPAAANVQSAAGDDGESRPGPADDDPAGDAPAGDGDTTSSDPDTPAPTDDDEIDLAEDIVRRYLNGAYGYSLELVCGPFCNATSNALDRVGFLSDDRSTLINIEVVRADAEAPLTLAELEELWHERNETNESFMVLNRVETTLASDGVSPALLFEWTVDRRATGGFEEHYKSLLTQVGPIAYLINAGGIGENFETMEPFLDQALDSFLARPNPPAVPGEFSRWDFLLPYDAEAFTGEFGNRTPTASFDSGIFLQQAATGPPQLLLIWDSISQSLFDADETLDEVLLPGGGFELTVDERGDTEVDGQPARFAVATSTDTTGNATRTVAYAWYCEDSGRSFVLQSFDPADPVPRATAALDGFRCTAP